MIFPPHVIVAFKFGVIQNPNPEADGDEWNVDKMKRAKE